MYILYIYNSYARHIMYNKYKNTFVDILCYTNCLVCYIYDNFMLCPYYIFVLHCIARPRVMGFYHYIDSKLRI